MERRLVKFGYYSSGWQTLSYTDDEKLEAFKIFFCD